MRRFRTVASVGVLYQFTLNLPNGDLFPGAAAVDGTFGNAVDRPLLVDGRLPRPKRAARSPSTRRSPSNSISVSATI